MGTLIVLMMLLTACCFTGGDYRSCIIAQTTIRAQADYIYIYICNSNSNNTILGDVCVYIHDCIFVASFSQYT